MTRERRAILEAVVGISPAHFDVPGVLEFLERGGREERLKYARATVYRTLEILVEAGIVRRMQLASGRASYELELGKEHHEHLVCTSCGKVIEFEKPAIERLQDEVCEAHGFQATSHILKISGICRECRSGEE